MTDLRVRAWRPARRWLARHDVHIVRGQDHLRFPHVLGTVLRRQATTLVIDVGANQGQFVGLLRESAAYDGPILSIEPVPSSYRSLVARWERDPRWTGLNLACGDAEGVVEMLHHPEHPELDSLHGASDYGRERFRRLREEPEAVQVTVQRLDGLVTEIDAAGGVPRTIHLKCDTQGHDLAVLRGATGLIDRVSSLQVELPSLHIYDGAPMLSDAVAEVVALGFDPVGFFPVGYDRDELRPIEFDGLFVRRPAAA